MKKHLAFFYSLAVFAVLCVAYPALGDVVGTYVRRAGDTMSGTLNIRRPANTNALVIKNRGYFVLEDTDGSQCKARFVNGAITFDATCGITSGSGFTAAAGSQYNCGTGRCIYEGGLAAGSGLTNEALRFRSSTNLGDGDAMASFYDNYTTLGLQIMSTGLIRNAVQTVTIADDAGGAAPDSTVTPTKWQVNLAYNDATNASVGTITETNAVDGSWVYIVHTGTGGSVVFSEIAGQQIMGAGCTLNAEDVLIAFYTNSAWYRVGCEDN